MATGIRLLYIHTTAPESPIGSTDAWGYHRLALNLDRGNGFSLRRQAPYVPDNVRTPLYPAFLLLIRRTLGRSLRAAVVVQALLDGFTTLGTYGLATQTARTLDVAPPASRRTGRLAALLYALNPNQIRTVNELLTETLLSGLLTCFLCVLVQYVYVRTRTTSGERHSQVDRLAVALGLLAGLAALCKPNVQFLLLIWLPCILIAGNRRHQRYGNPPEIAKHRRHIVGRLSIAAVLPRFAGKRRGYRNPPYSARHRRHAVGRLSIAAVLPRFAGKRRGYRNPPYIAKRRRHAVGRLSIAAVLPRFASKGGGYGNPPYIARHRRHAVGRLSIAAGLPLHWRSAGLAAIAFLAVITPWIARNALAFGRPLLSTAFEGNVSRVSAPATLLTARGEHAIPWSAGWEEAFGEIVAQAAERYGWDKPWETLSPRELDAANRQVYRVARQVLSEHPLAWLGSHALGTLRYLEPQLYRVLHARWTGQPWPPDVLDDALIHAVREIARGEWQTVGQIIGQERWARIDPLQRGLWWGMFTAQMIALVLTLRGAWRLRTQPVLALGLLGTIAYVLWLPGPIAYERFRVPVMSEIATLIALATVERPAGCQRTTCPPTKTVLSCQAYLARKPIVRPSHTEEQA